MSKNLSKSIVPEFRFPEFENESEWVNTTLGEVTKKITNNKNKEGINYPVYSINNIEGFIPQSEQFNGIDSKGRGYDIKLYKIVGKNTFAYNPARINIGSIGYSGELHDVIISSLYICFKTNKKVNDRFLHYFFETSIFNQSVLNNVEGGIRNYLFYDNFARIELKFPSNLAEQQKIADCLTSIDNLIKAQTQKLDALKTHKKGLMQQLFPTNGEKVPKLRFPEFVNDGEWKQEPLIEMSTIVTGSTPKTSDKQNYDGNILFVSPADISDERFVTKTKTTLSKQGYSKTRHIPANSILFVCIGSTIGKIAQARYECATNQQINTVIPNEGFSFDFMYYALSSIASEISSLAGKQAVPIINKTLFSSVLVFATSPEEQQKIANCLSSIDGLISTQTQKVDALKDHKKGLMQQLFPQI